MHCTEALLCVVLASSLSSLVSSSEQTQVIIRTSKGEVSGYIHNAFNEGSPLLHGLGYAFLGIPFAKPPVGQRRLTRPEENDAWTERLNATYYRPQCPNVFPSHFAPMNEDCLYVNVFTPIKQPPVDKPYPVMVWIYGGSFITGSADYYRPAGIITNFINKDVIVVTFNYRLGLLGQFTTLTPEFPANLGLFDQLLALKWVQREIGFFGGDANKVTIFGESAGGCSVSYHVYSPLSKGLFHGAIIESGSAMLTLEGNVAGFSHSSQQAALDLCAISSDRWNSGDFVGLRDCLVNLTVDEIIKYGPQLSGPNKRWYPSVDGPGGFLPAFPRHLAANRSNVPILMGTNRDEAIVFTGFLGASPTTVAKITRAYYTFFLNSLIPESEFGNYTPAVRAAVDQEYRVKANISADDHLGWLRLIVQMTTDRGFPSLTSQMAARMNETANAAEVYLYSFEYSSDAFPILSTTGYKCVPHGYELPYVFVMDRSFDHAALTDTDVVVIRHFSDWWTSFAKTGRPTSAETPVHWPPLDAANTGQYMYIGGDKVEMKQDYYKEASHFWNVVVPSIAGGSVGPTFGPPVNQTAATSPPTQPTMTISSTRINPTTTGAARNLAQLALVSALLVIVRNLFE